MSFVLLFLLFSCSSLVEPPVITESLIVVYVDEFKKTVSDPYVELEIVGREEPLHFDIKAPAAVDRMAASSVVKAIGWSTNGEMTLNAPNEFEFSAPGGSAILLPWKISLVNKSRVEIRPMTALDIKYAKSQFAGNPRFAELSIDYPEITVD